MPASGSGPKAHAPTENTLRYIETMLRGDTDRIQVADYIADHVIPAARSLSQSKTPGSEG